MAQKWIRNELRLAIYERDNKICAYCGIECSADENANHGISLDHIKPRSKGGTNSPKNLVVSCRGCNSTRQDTPIEKWLKQVNRDMLIIELRISKQINHSLKRKLANMPVKQARQFIGLI